MSAFVATEELRGALEAARGALELLRSHRGNESDEELLEDCEELRSDEETILYK